MDTLYDYFNNSLYKNYYMKDEDEKILYDYKNQLSYYLNTHRYDRGYDRNKYKRLQVCFNFLNKKLQEYDTLKNKGLLIAKFQDTDEGVIRLDGLGEIMEW